MIALSGDYERERGRKRVNVDFETGNWKGSGSISCPDWT
jgi:hypothetical protein